MMKSGEADVLSCWNTHSYACTPERQGVWTLWWRYKQLRDLLDPCDRSECSGSSAPPTQSERAASNNATAKELALLRNALQDNGLIVHDQSADEPDGD